MKEQSKSLFSYPTRLYIKNIEVIDPSSKEDKKKQEMLISLKSKSKTKEIFFHPLLYRAIPKDKRIDNVEDIANLEEIKYLINENIERDKRTNYEKQKTAFFPIYTNPDMSTKITVRVNCDYLYTDVKGRPIVGFNFKLFGLYYRTKNNMNVKQGQTSKGFSSVSSSDYNFDVFGNISLDDHDYDKMNYEYEDYKITTDLYRQSIYYHIKERVPMHDLNNDNNFIIFQINYTAYSDIDVPIKEDPFPELPITEYYVVPYRIVID